MPDRLRKLIISECAIYQGCLRGICDGKELVFAEAESFGGQGAESCCPVCIYGLTDTTTLKLHSTVGGHGGQCFTDTVSEA